MTSMRIQHKLIYDKKSSRPEVVERTSNTSNTCNNVSIRAPARGATEF